MISPHTPPGTRVICVNAKVGGFNTNINAVGDMDGLTQWETYTVRKIDICRFSKSGFTVDLTEIDRRPSVIGQLMSGFDIARFRYASLPKSLTDLLHSVPSDLERVDQ